MKTTNSIINSSVSVMSNFLMILTNFIAQSFFIKFLGNEFLGLNGLFTNIISMLSIVELGLGSAIIYNLYRPLSTGDQKTVSSLMRFYKKTYHIIAIVVLVIGLCLLPILPFFVGHLTIRVNYYFSFFLFTIDSSISYLMSYKRSILIADQKNYIINIVHVLILLMLNFFQIIFLYISRNYYIYISFRILFHFFENLIITLYVNKKYSYISSFTETLDKKIENDIFTKIKALIFHKIGGFVISGTDNMIISRFLGIVYVGLYSNYYMIINAVNTLFGQAMNSLTSSVGHLLIEKDKNKNYDVFCKIRFINFWLAVFLSTSILCTISTFVEIWIGKFYVLSNFVLISLIVNFYQNLMRNSYSVFKEAAGIFYEDRFVPIIESIINIIFSIIFVNIFGLAGVFIGTIISSLVLWLYSYPKYIYIGLFGKKYVNYYIENFKYFIIFIIISIVSFSFSSFFCFDNLYISLIVKMIICLLLPNIIVFIIFRNDSNFIYFISLMKTILRKIYKSIVKKKLAIFHI